MVSLPLRLLLTPFTPYVSAAVDMKISLCMPPIPIPQERIRLDWLVTIQYGYPCRADHLTSVKLPWRSGADHKLNSSHQNCVVSWNKTLQKYRCVQPASKRFFFFLIYCLSFPTSPVYSPSFYPCPSENTAINILPWCISKGCQTDLSHFKPKIKWKITNIQRKPC